MRPLVLIVLVLLGCHGERGRLFEVDRRKPKAATTDAICRGETTKTRSCSDLRPDARVKRVRDRRVIARVEPRYPAAAREHRIGGLVILEVGVRKDGTVGGVCVAKPLPCGLSDAAAEAVRQWRFEQGDADTVTMITVYFDPAAHAF
jgi:TonB family protein